MTELLICVCGNVWNLVVKSWMNFMTECQWQPIYGDGLNVNRIIVNGSIQKWKVVLNWKLTMEMELAK